MKTMFKRAVFGTGEYLSRTENIVHTLGCITALCCTDKKGILSWPNQVRDSRLLLDKFVLLNDQILNSNFRYQRGYFSSRRSPSP